MTMTRIEPVVPAAHSPRTRVRAREWWKDLLEATAWLAGTGGVAFMFASGTARVASLPDLSNTLGRATGIAASTMIMVQMILASRAPFVERFVGHDRALALHGRLGRVGFFVILAHILTITAGYAHISHLGFVDQAIQFVVGYGGPMLMAVLGFAVLCAVILTSLMAVRKRWSYENWHAVHIFSYAAIVLSIPHQFLNGSTFRLGGFPSAYWLVLWTVSVVSLVGWRIVKPVVRFYFHDIRVADVRTLEDGTAVITLTGRHLMALRPRAGQFLLWRFLTKDLWDEAHPYSLSRAPRDRWMRITVKPLGDHSAKMRHLKPGTRVMAEGPLGIFHERTRTGRKLVLAGAGIGITPVLAMLEGSPFAPGECTVIVRASTLADATHLDEIEHLAAQRGATVYTFIGRRGAGWAPKDTPATLARLVPDIAHADVYACGPEPWTKALLADARRSGVPEEALHTELFAW